MSEGKPKLRPTEIQEIDVFLLKRLHELTGGEHKSVFFGSGFDFVGVREWQPGDKLASIDWPQSALNNYDPILVRDFEEDKSGTIFIVADASLSMQCGINGFSSSDVALRAIATIGLSGVFFQDLVGLFMFDQNFGHDYLRPKMGRKQVMNCVNKYVDPHFSYGSDSYRDLAKKIMGNLKRVSLIPVISDFLFSGSSDFIASLSDLKTRHDLFVAVIDSDCLFNLPPVSAGWIECVDIENGRKIMLSRREFLRMSQKAADYQNGLIAQARAKGVDVIKIGQDKAKLYNSLAEFFLIRRTKRKVAL